GAAIVLAGAFSPEAAKTREATPPRPIGQLLVLGSPHRRGQVVRQHYCPPRTSIAPACNVVSALRGPAYEPHAPTEPVPQSETSFCALSGELRDVGQRAYAAPRHVADRSN